MRRSDFHSQKQAATSDFGKRKGGIGHPNDRHLDASLERGTLLASVHAPVEEHQNATPAPTYGGGRRRGILIAVVVLLLAVLIVGYAVMDREWPFTRAAVIQALQQQSGGAVQVQSFRQMYLPVPGCVAEGVTLRRGNSDGQPFLTIQRLTITSNYPSLLAHHISSIKADGLHITVAPQSESSAEASPAFNVGSFNSGLTIGKIVADGAAVEFAPTTDRRQAFILRTPKLMLHDLGAGKPLAFQATVQIPQPPAEVDVEGKFGAWQAGHGGESALSGTYNLKSLDLGTFGGIGGILTSKGHFDGVLQHVNVKGKVDTPKFTVRTSGHPIHLVAEYAATVNGLNGDVDVNAAQISFGRTTINASGSVSGKEGQKGKTAVFDLSSRKARVQDLLWMFISESTPPMAGPITFRAKATLPPGNRPFLNKLALQGDFGISDAQYPHPDTQKNVDVLSARARGQADKVEDANEKLGNDSYDPGRVLSNLKGHVVTTNAVANLSNLTFDVPGASAKVKGTFKLKTQEVDLQGYMHLDSELSKTTTGVKSVLLKVMEPFMKKGKRNESVIAIKIGGTYQNPTYGIVPRAEK
jgi:hypothetical protein